MEELRSEMRWSLDGSGSKDVLVVVRDQFEHVKNCLESVFRNTEDFTLHLWDNASGNETRRYLEEVAARSNVKLYRSENNEGFICHRQGNPPALAGGRNCRLV